MTTVRAEIAAAVRRTGQPDNAFQSPPAAVFWPDPDRAWLNAIPQLREALPLLTLGAFDPAAATGPAIWIRAALSDPAASAVGLPPQFPAADDRQPWVIYLPGFHRDAFADTGRLDPLLAPLADLQRRSRWWVQGNRQPWTPTSFLRTRDGVGLDVARDDNTRTALTAALTTIVDEQVDNLRKVRHWDAARFHERLVPDDVSLVLQWLDDPDGLRARLLAEQTWVAFVSVCRSSYDLHPESDTPLDAAERLGRREGAWRQVWSRFVEAPQRYPRLPDLLDRAAPTTLFGDDPHPDSRPAWNSEQEGALRTALAELGSTQENPSTAIARLEDAHGRRRDSVWGQLGRAPLAEALRRLHQLASAIRTDAPRGDLASVVDWYVADGHRVDDAALAALAAVASAGDRAAVVDALSTLYDPWLDDAARTFQQAAAGTYRAATGLAIGAGTCVVFVDGLRYDLGRRLADRLVAVELDVELTHRMAAFPTVTPCGQPAVAPLSTPVGPGPGMAAGDEHGRSLSGPVFRQGLAASGVDFLADRELGDPTAKAWTQTNDIDALGHAHGHKLADLLGHELDLVTDRIETLISAGWRQVVVVTDHGFLLPAKTAAKVDLALHLTEGDAARKPRVARLKTGQTTSYPTLPWTWDDTVTMVSAPGVAAFVAGRLYEHGGLSPQECVTPLLTVQRDGGKARHARIEALRWTGFRCRVDIYPSDASVSVEMRYAPGDHTSRIGAAKPAVDGEAKLLISEDDADEGTAVTVVLLDELGNVVDQRRTSVKGT